MRKSSVDEIRERFDNDVERFSTLSIGQTTTVDAVLAMDLITHAASLVNPDASHILDVGCGAGNYTLKLLQRQCDLDVTLVDLSRPMLDRARERIAQVTEGEITTMQGDIRDLEIGEERYDIILAAAVLHHLRDESQWLYWPRPCCTTSGTSPSGSASSRSCTAPSPPVAASGSSTWWNTIYLLYRNSFGNVTASTWWTTRTRSSATSSTGTSPKRTRPNPSCSRLT